MSASAAAGRLLPGARILAVSVVLAFSALVPAGARAAGASWSFEPSSWDFGARVPAEGRSEPKSLVLTNTGAVSLEPALVSLISDEGSDFGFTDDCQGALAPGHSCEIDVTFQVTTAGQKTASLEVSERSSLVAPALASLTGSGAPPLARIEPRELSFSSTPIRGSSPAQTVTVTDEGPSDLSFSAVAVYPSFGSGHEPFELTSVGCEPWTVLKPGDSCSDTVDFDPLALGAAQGEITFFDNAADSPQKVRLSGTGEPEAPPPGLAVETTPPSAVRLDRKPGRRTRHRDAIFVFSPEDASTDRFQCGLGGGPLVSWCRSPVRFPSLKPGRHLFRVRAVGGDGVPGPTVSYRWRVLR